MSAAAVLGASRQHSEQIGGGCIMKGLLFFVLSRFTSRQVGWDYWEDCDQRLQIGGVAVGLVGHGICIHLFAGNTAVLKQDLMRVLSGKACAACQLAAIIMYTEKKKLKAIHLWWHLVPAVVVLGHCCRENMTLLACLHCPSLCVAMEAQCQPHCAQTSFSEWNVL